MQLKNTLESNGIAGIKRPRGRPPLALSGGKRKYDMLGSRTIFLPPSPVVPSPVAQVQAEIKPSKDSSNDAAIKTMKPHLVVQKVLARLMTEDPVSVSALMQLIPDASKDVIQSSLDILQVLGVVVSVKPRSQSANSSSSTSNTSYTMVNFGRGVTSVAFLEIMERLGSKLSQADSVRKRIRKLEELSIKISTEQDKDKLLTCRTYITSMLLEDDSLLHDPLYSSVAANFGIKK